MTFKTISVYVDDHDDCVDRIRVALAIAQRFGAHVNGLYVRRSLQIPTVTQIESGTGLIEAQQTMINELEVAASSRFSDTVKSASPEVVTEWRVLDGPRNDELENQARYSDLLIIGPPSTNPDETGITDSIVLNTGGPVLALPNGVSTVPGRHVLIGWNGSREAARAVHDAIPFIKTAEQIRVTSIHTPQNVDADQAARCCAHLAKHGLEAVSENHILDRTHDAGKKLLELADEQMTDLIVIGAYAHRRIREIVFGGVTRDLLIDLKIPVFMSH